MGINIKKYAPFFHDGQLREIQYEISNLSIIMESAELLPEWNEDSIDLSRRNTISGKLHIIGIKSIQENERFLEIFQTKNSFIRAHIHDFEVSGNKVLLILWWIRYPYEESDAYRYEIEAEEIFWENIPTLSDEYWEKIDEEQDVE